MTKPVYKDRSYRVTQNSFRKPGRTFRLENCEQTRLARPGLLAGLALSAACWGFVGTFNEILYDEEVAALILGPLILLPLAAKIAVLTIEYRGLGGVGRVVGWSHRLACVRRAIDDVLEAREPADHDGPEKDQ